MIAIDIMGIVSFVFILIPSFIFLIILVLYINSEQGKKDAEKYCKKYLYP